VLLLDEGPSLGDVLRCPRLIIEPGDQLEFPAEDTALGVDVVEIGLDAVEPRRVRLSDRVRDAGDATDVDRGRRDPRTAAGLRRRGLHGWYHERDYDDERGHRGIEAIHRPSPQDRPTSSGEL